MQKDEPSQSSSRRRIAEMMAGSDFTPHNGAANMQARDGVAAFAAMPSDRMPKGNPIVIVGLAIVAWVPFALIAMAFLR